MGEWQYAEQILHIDLTRRTACVESTSIDLKRNFVGGAGFVARLLTSPDRGTQAGARVALAAGPLSDGLSGRLSMGAAPVGLGQMALSSMGGRMAQALKGAGYDAVVIEGQLDRPGMLMVSAEGVQILDADELWGQEVPATERMLVEQLGPHYAPIVLGPAAENAVPFATVAHEGHYAGGSGVACAMGSQRVKALLIRDTVGVAHKCTGCTLACPGKLSPMAQLAGDLGLDAPAAERLVTLAEAAGMLDGTSEPMRAMAHRTGVGRLLAEGEEALLDRVGPDRERLLQILPPKKRRSGLGVADLLGICQRVWRERPFGVMHQALTSTQGLLAGAV